MDHLRCHTNEALGDGVVALNNFSLLLIYGSEGGTKCHGKTQSPARIRRPRLHKAGRRVRRLPPQRESKTQILVAELVYGTAKKYGVTIYKFANVGNHLHLLIKISRISRWAAFIRELTGRIAQVATAQLGLSGRFWLYRTAKMYVHLNWLQAEGFISRRETKTLKDLRAIFDG